MPKKNKKFRAWQEEYDSDRYEKTDGKRYNSKKEWVKQARDRKDRQKNSFFEPAKQ